MFEIGGAAAGTDREVPVDGFAARADAERELVDRLGGIAGGAELALILEQLLAPLLMASDGDETGLGSGAAGEGSLLDGVLDPAERELLLVAGATRVSSAALEDLAGAGAETLSALVAACGRLASWAGWAQALLALALSRNADMAPGAAPWGPGGGAGGAAALEERRFNATSEVACRLGISRARATRLLERGEGLADHRLARTASLTRVGLLDEAKAALITNRLRHVEDELARAVQDDVLPRAPHRAHSQLARDLERSLIAHDPEGRGERRCRNVAERRVTRPRSAGEGVHEMRLLLPTMDAFLLDATLDAVAASARAIGDERTLSQLRADAAVGMCLSTLRLSQGRALSGGGAAGGGAVGGATTAGSASVADPCPQGCGCSTGCSTDCSAGCSADRSADRSAFWPGPVSSSSQRALMPDGVPLEGLLVSLSDLVGSSSPWWTPSGTAPVPLRAGLSISVDVTVPLDQLLPEGSQTVEDAALGSRGPSPSRGALAHTPTGDGPPHGGAEGPPPGLVNGPMRRPTAPPTVTVGGRSAPVPAVVARALASGGTWRRLVTDPVTGAVLDIGRTRYRPPAALADAVRARDRSCTHPGCEVPARRCDLDHVRAWADGGTTSLENLTCLCEAHHRLKHTPGWALHRAEDGALVWRTPSGDRYRRELDGTVRCLARRVGPRSYIRRSRVMPRGMSDALTGPLLDRLERALAVAERRQDAGRPPCAAGSLPCAAGDNERGMPERGMPEHGVPAHGGLASGGLASGGPARSVPQRAGTARGGQETGGKDRGVSGPGLGKRGVSEPGFEEPGSQERGVVQRNAWSERRGLTTRGPRPGEPIGAFETVPYPPALHELGLAALLDAAPAF